MNGPNYREVGLSAGVISLGEAGNLGDDLILIAVLEALGASRQVSLVRYLSHDSPLDWDKIRARFPSIPIVEPIKFRYEYPLQRWSRDAFQDCDFVIFGGGGLIQDTHHPIRPYHWLRFLPERKPVYAVGLGLGPVSDRWRKFLHGESYFEQTFLRDDESLALAQGSFGWSSEYAHDFVDLPFLDQGLEPFNVRPSLGVALRAWPGLDEARLVQSVERLVREEKLEKVEFYVLESKQGVGSDVDLSRRVASQVTGARSEVNVYSGGDSLGFASRMRGCSHVISMKLHSSAIWASSRAIQRPVIYAPKVASFFGVPWRGLEIVDAPIAPDFPSVPKRRAKDVVMAVAAPHGTAVAGRRISSPQRLRFQVHGLAYDLVQKFGRRVGNG